VTIPGGTNASPYLALLGTRLYVSWKGHTTDDVFWSSAAVTTKIGTWSSQSTIPVAKTHHGVAIAVTGPTLTIAWTGPTTGKYFYAQADLASGGTNTTP
jgi:hypothetical protein